VIAPTDRNDRGIFAWPMTRPLDFKSAQAINV
jgi:hypothetical protein